MKVSKAVIERLREIANKKDISLYKLQKDSGMPEGTFCLWFMEIEKVWT